MPPYEYDRLCQQIVEDAQEAIIFADRDGIIRLWNSGAQAIFGYTAEEALGQTLDLIIPQQYRDRHWEGYNRVMSTGKTRLDKELLAVPAIRKDGGRVSLEFSIVLMRDTNNELIGIAAIIHEVTERRQREKEMKERLATLEAKMKNIST